MRDLEQRIADWRRTMATALGERGELLDELEEHLREEIDRSLRGGVSKDEAFDRALSKLGMPSAIVAEYDKLALAGQTWWPVKAARICVGAGLLVMAAMLLSRKAGILLSVHFICVGLGYLAMFAVGGMGICYICARWFGGPGPLQRHSLFRSTFQFASLAVVATAVAVILGMVWTKENWGRYWAWDPKETGGVLVVFWAMVVSILHCFKATQMTVMVCGILGSALTACAWFGTTSTSLAMSPLLAVFLVTHFFFLAMVPALRLRKGRPSQL